MVDDTSNMIRGKACHGLAFIFVSLFARYAQRLRTCPAGDQALHKNSPVVDGLVALILANVP
jgi:hypothetical protein